MIYPSIPQSSRLAADYDVQPASVVHDLFPGMVSTDRAAHEQILHRAYAIWQSEGHPRGRELANWLAAEVEVMGRT